MPPNSITLGNLFKHLSMRGNKAKDVHYEIHRHVYQMNFAKSACFNGIPDDGFLRAVPNAEFGRMGDLAHFLSGLGSPRPANRCQ